jgi:hypothetical protein
MSIKWKLNYGLAAVVAAIVVIGVALVTNPILINPSVPDPIFTGSSFLVMLTDPPTVPNGTSLLNLTYTDMAFHIIYPNSTSEWVSINVSGTVNLLSLVNMSQTLAATTIPTGSNVDKIQFTIKEVTAVINGEIQDVTVLSNNILMTISNSNINQTLSGVLIDFNPTLVEIQSEDVEGNAVNYYVLVPSAAARIISNLNQEQSEVGTIVELEERHREELREHLDEISRNITIVETAFSADGNVTSLSVTIKNQGNTTFRVFGLTLHGEFNSTRTIDRATGRYGQNQEAGNQIESNIRNETEANSGKGNNNNGNQAGYGIESGNSNRPEHAANNWNGNSNNTNTFSKIHPRTIPFKVNETSIVPLFGSEYEQKQWNTSLILQPEDTITLTFKGVISLQSGKNNDNSPITVITPILDSNYTIKLMGEGNQTFYVTTSP